MLWGVIINNFCLLQGRTTTEEEVRLYGHAKEIISHTNLGWYSPCPFMPHLKTKKRYLRQPRSSESSPQSSSPSHFQRATMHR